MTQPGGCHGEVTLKAHAIALPVVSSGRRLYSAVGATPNYRLIRNHPANPLGKPVGAVDDTFPANNMPGELTELEFSLIDVIDNRPLTPVTVDLPTLRRFLEEVEKLIK